MNSFYEKIEPAHDQLLSRNDLFAYLNNAILGEFDDGDDVKYFKNLRGLYP